MTNTAYLQNVSHVEKCIMIRISIVRLQRSRNDLPLEKSEKHRIHEYKNAVQLALDHVQKEDAGLYTLFAETRNGSSTRKDVELVVQDHSSGEDPPIIARRLADLSVKVGTRTRLLVEIKSSTKTKVRLANPQRSAYDRFFLHI